MFYKSSITSSFGAERKQVESVSVNIGSDFTCTSPLHFGGKKKIIVLSCPDTCTQLFSAATSSKCILAEDLGWTHSHTNQSFSAATFFFFKLIPRLPRLSPFDERLHISLCVLGFSTRGYSPCNCRVPLSDQLFFVSSKDCGTSLFHYHRLSNWHVNVLTVQYSTCMH